jgi:hypothetical protein
MQGRNPAPWSGRSFRESDTRAKQGSISFLKKRNKKLLLVARSHPSNQVDAVSHETDKSFLVLFFKKELLSCRQACPEWRL